jgi:outer membrane protein assembly factor BamB
LTLISVSAGLIQVATGDEWPQFLGPDRNGISAEMGLVDSFPAAGPKQVWRVPGGVGMSGLVICRGKLLTTVQAEGSECVVALDAATGKQLWRTSIGPAFDNSQGPGTRATPTIAGERVFAFTGDGVLVALNFADGGVLWSQNLVEQFQGRPADYGMASSPLVVGERVIVIVGAPGGSVVALDAATGKPAWSVGNDPPGYSSPTLVEVGGRRQVVAFTGNSVLGLLPDSGAILWRHPYVTDFNCNTATPVSASGGVYVSSGENHGGTLLELKPNGEAFDVAPKWASLGPQSTLRAEWQTPIVLDGRIYGFDNVGGAGPITHLTCIDAATGERVWQKLRFGKGNMIAADGKLWISTLAGELILVRATPEAYTELGRADVDISTRQAPTLSDGLLYLRDDASIVCFDVRK